MTRDDIDIMWNKALGQAIKDGEQFTRYHFAAFVAAAEREACAKVCEEQMTKWPFGVREKVCAAAIRARGQE